MTWDAALADERTKEFQKDLKILLSVYQDDDIKVAISVLNQLQALWQKHFMQTGHKRLARVFLKEGFE